MPAFCGYIGFSCGLSAWPNGRRKYPYMCRPQLIGCDYAYHKPWSANLDLLVFQIELGDFVDFNLYAFLDRVKFRCNIA